jgi:hypothetical protein
VQFEWLFMIGYIGFCLLLAGMICSLGTARMQGEQNESVLYVTTENRLERN